MAHTAGPDYASARELSNVRNDYLARDRAALVGTLLGVSAP
jgi:hypothetical protein